MAERVTPSGLIVIETEDAVEDESIVSSELGFQVWEAEPVAYFDPEVIDLTVIDVTPRKQRAIIQWEQRMLQDLDADDLVLVDDLVESDWLIQSLVRRAPEGFIWFPLRQMYSPACTGLLDESPWHSTMCARYRTIWRWRAAEILGGAHQQNCYLPGGNAGRVMKVCPHMYPVMRNLITQCSEVKTGGS